MGGHEESEVRVTSWIIKVYEDDDRIMMTIEIPGSAHSAQVFTEDLEGWDQPWYARSCLLDKLRDTLDDDWNT